MIISLKKLFLLLLFFFFTQATLERSKDDVRDPCYYTRRVKEAINIRLLPVEKGLLPDNINRDSGIEIPENHIYKITHDQSTSSPEED